MSEPSTSAAAADQTAASRLSRLWGYHAADLGNVNLLRDIAREALGGQAFADAIKALDALHALGASQANDEAAAVHALTRLGQVGPACERAERARQTWPEDQALRLETVRALFNAGRFELAFELAQHAPFTEPALEQMGGELTLHALWHLGRLEDGIDLGTQLIQRWPDNPRILALLSAVLYDEERTDEAFALAHRAYAVSPAHAYQALHVLASERLLKGDPAGALQLVEQAQHMRADDGRIWLIRGSAHMAQGRLDDAATDLGRALHHYPNHPGTHITLAWLRISQQRLSEAEAAARDALAASPAFAESHGTLAVVQALQGQTDEARQSIRRATLLDKESFAARYAQALLDGQVPERIEGLLADVMRRAGAGQR